jgi:hypothetical protein
MKSADEIIEKIRKCLALANGRNSTQGEMEAAMGRAKEIAMRHGIELGSLKMEDGLSKKTVDIVNDGTTTTKTKFRQPYHRWICSALENIFGVRTIHVVTRSSAGVRILKLHIIGDPMDVEICKVLFPWLEKAFPAIFWNAVRMGHLGNCAAHANGCYQGIALGLRITNEREEEKLSSEDKNTWAMVVRNKSNAVQNKVSLDFPKLESKRARVRQSSEQARQYGRKKGEQINLRQMGNAPGKMVRIRL